jgi:hypothetical protein
MVMAGLIKFFLSARSKADELKSFPKRFPFRGADWKVGSFGLRRMDRLVNSGSCDKCLRKTGWFHIVKPDMTLHSAESIVLMNGEGIAHHPSNHVASRVGLRFPEIDFISLLDSLTMLIDAPSVGFAGAGVPLLEMLHQIKAKLGVVLKDPCRKVLFHHFEWSLQELRFFYDKPVGKHFPGNGQHDT